MVLKIYSVRDSKAAFFGRPFFAANNGVAVRSFSDLANDKNTEVNRHPGDFDLYCLGEFDDNSGGLSTKPQPEFLNSATEFIEAVSN